MPKSVKRPVVGVDRTLQHNLFDVVEADEAATQPIAQRQANFNNPDPRELRIGNSRVDEHLEQMGFTDALVVRDLLQGQDWSAFEARYSPNGRRAYHPALMAGIVLFGLMRGISSLRELERFARTDVSCWWVSGGISPDHSVLGRFITHHEQELSDQLFEGVVEAALKGTASSRHSVAGDGTMMEAMSSRYGVLRREAASARVAQLREAGDGASAEAQRLEQMCVVLDERRARGGGRGHELLNPREPEAVVVKQKNGSRRPGYAPAVLANDARVVVDAELGIGHELAPMEAMVERLPEETEELLVDSGLRAASLLQKARNKQIQVLAPAKGGEPDTDNSRSLGKKKKYFEVDQFSYNPDTDEVTCPAGHKLTRSANYRNKERKRYKTKACADCALRGQCTSKKQRTIERTDATRLREELSKRMSDPEKQIRYAQRKAMVEPVFSAVRMQHKLMRFRRAHGRGARLEWRLHMMAHNLGRVVAARLCRYFWQVCTKLKLLQSNLGAPNLETAKN